jgi:hypothetical protein
MATPSKSLSLQDLSGAVRSAVANLKAPPPAEAGPYAYINPSLICGIWYAGRLAQITDAHTIATAIAKQVSAHLGVTVAPVVQEAATEAVAEHGASLLPPHHVICGYRPVPESFLRF